MNGKFVRLTPAPQMELHQNGKPFAQFDPKTIYLVEGADPIIIGRASSRDKSRFNDPDNGYLKVPTGQTALGREHAFLCLRNNALYIAMKQRDGMILDASSGHWRSMGPHSEYYPVLNRSRIYLNQFECHRSQGPKFSKIFEPVTVTQEIFEGSKPVTKTAKRPPKTVFHARGA
ncbi:hypothetical protein B0H12DRAFT_1114477 [Mycena haematopus]|nr:hypothetical protein B0H12DRAFT_1114477 [Mycena haematopus]